MGVEYLVKSHTTTSASLHLKKRNDNGYLFYYLESNPDTITHGYPGSHDLKDMMRKFNYLSNKLNQGGY